MRYLFLIALTLWSFDAMAERPLKDLSELDDMQKYVTQHDGTEPAFKNKYWDNSKYRIRGQG